jgi:signal transduction histidine kinase/ActR/RegA family two-component response regulator
MCVLSAVTDNRILTACSTQSVMQNTRRKEGMEMKKMNRASRIVTCLLSVLCLLAQFPFLAFAEESGRETVKVAVLNHTTYADRNEDGEWSGMDIDCMISIAQKAGFDLQFIDSSTDADFLGGLDSGKYDIVADVTKTSAREAAHLFTDEAIGSTDSTLAVRAADDRWDYGNIEQVSRMKVGVIASYANNADFRSWCAKHNVTPKITEYQDAGQMADALLGGQIDAEVYTAVFNTVDSTKLRTIMKFLPESFYYAFRKDDTALKNKVDDALSQLLAGNPTFLVDIKNKYEIKYKVNDLPFSTAEKEYIAAHPLLTVAAVDGDAPYYTKGKDGRDRGILPDYYAFVARDTGFRFRYIAYRSQTDAIAAVQSGKADILGIYSGGIISSQKNKLALTDGIATVNSILLTKSGMNLSRVKNIAVKNYTDRSLLDGIAAEFPKADVKTYENAAACFRALERGKTTAILIGLPSATWIINQTNSSVYSIIPMPGASSTLCGAVGNDNQILCSILNKRIASTRDNFTGIVTKDTLSRNDLKTTIARVPPTLTILVFSILLLLILVLAWSLAMLRRRQRERAAVLAAQAETERQKLQIETIKRSTEERNRFFANISHDMRTPLNAIIGFSDLAEKTDDAEQKDSYIAKVKSSGQLLNSLIDDTLTISKMSSGKLELHPKAMSTQKVGSTIVETIRIAAAQKNIALSIDTRGYRPRVIYADELNLQKLFLNVLSNAVKYTPAGGHIWIKIWDGPKKAGEQTICFSIRDDGIGISPEFLPHIFEPFTQEKRPGYESMGTGLGMAIVKQNVDLMGGTIEVGSKVDQGTEFLIRLPFRELDETEYKPLEAAAVPAANLNGRKILLCEDNKLNREIAVALLNRQQVDVETAANGRDGIERFKDSAPGTYDAILMDIQMPVMDGITATRTIRSLDREDAKTVPIIAMTADAFDESIRKAKEAGMNGYLTKPLNPDVMLQTIAENLRS